MNGREKQMVLFVKLDVVCIHWSMMRVLPLLRSWPLSGLPLSRLNVPWIPVDT